jgi:hypothetical protein
MGEGACVSHRSGPVPNPQEDEMNARQKLLWDAVGGLGKPSKMPGYAYGISAHSCKLGALLAKKEGSTCSECYALKGHYQYPNVTAAHARRLDAMREHPEDWTCAMIELIGSLLDPFPYADRVFRWHDSGDLQSAEHLAMLVTIAEELPRVRFWLPTREVGILSAYVAGGGVFPSNFRVRLSAHYIGKDAYLPDALARAGVVISTVDGPGVKCPAPKQGNKCGSCRRCWGKTPAVSYALH